jgi:hypothetical protein
MTRRRRASPIRLLDWLGIEPPERAIQLWRDSTPLHKLGWGLVIYDLGRSVLFSTPFSTTILGVATLLIGTQNKALKRRQEARNRKRGLHEPETIEEPAASSDGSASTT